MEDYIYLDNFNCSEPDKLIWNVYEKGYGGNDGVSFNRMNQINQISMGSIFVPDYILNAADSGFSGTLGLNLVSIFESNVLSNVARPLFLFKFDSTITKDSTNKSHIFVPVHLNQDLTLKQGIIGTNLEIILSNPFAKRTILPFYCRLKYITNSNLVIFNEDPTPYFSVGDYISADKNESTIYCSKVANITDFTVTCTSPLTAAGGTIYNHSRRMLFSMKLKY